MQSPLSGRRAFAFVGTQYAAPLLASGAPYRPNLPDPKWKRFRNSLLPSSRSKKANLYRPEIKPEESVSTQIGKRMLEEVIEFCADSWRPN